MRRARAGCPEAVRELFERYSAPIRHVVRRRLDRRLRPQYDSLDFVQSVWTSFIQIPPERYTFATPDDLVGFLARVAFTKVVTAYRKRLETAKRDLNREEPADGRPDGTLMPGRGPQPTPSQVVMASERWERLLQRLPEKYRQILVLLRQGYSQQEVADALGLNIRLVHRLVRKLNATAKP
jgi:RNA polymerase sigma-70 factor (ECF subfamily)